MSTIEIRHFPAVTKDSLYGAPINHPEHWQLFDEHGKRLSDVSYESREEAEAAAMSTIEIRHFPAVTKDSLYGAPINHPEHWQLFDEHGKRLSDVSYESREEAEAAAAGMRSATSAPPGTA